MPELDAITIVARDQKIWSATANSLKNGIRDARLIVLAITILVAIVETLGAQIHTAHSCLAAMFGYAGALGLAIAAVIRQRSLEHDRERAWILARSSSEAFKRELYLFRTSTGPYATGNPAETLLEKRAEILSKLEAVRKYCVEPKTEVKKPGDLDTAAYLSDRITGEKGQIAFYNGRASEYTSRQRLLRRAEFGLTLLGAFLGVGLTINLKQAFGGWLAVVTTIAGALAAHAVAQRYDQLIESYRVTAERLEAVVARWIANGRTGPLVVPCEAILSEENQSWIAGADQAPKPTRSPDPAGGSH